MGFYNLETLKEDAVRHGITVLNPDVNRSDELATIESDAFRMGLKHLANVGDATTRSILSAREKGGSFRSLKDFMCRTGVKQEPLDSLSLSGALDCLSPTSDVDANRRMLRWEVGLRYRQTGLQMVLDIPVVQDMVDLPRELNLERVLGEYASLGVHPSGHIMSYIRPFLPHGVIRSDYLSDCPEGRMVTVAGVVIRRQRPTGKATFITLEDEFGLSPLILWPSVYKRTRLRTINQILIARGKLSKRDGTLNVVVEDVSPVIVDSKPLKIQA